MTLYQWLPGDARGPKQHLTIGGLVYGETYNHPDCAHDPDFKLVEDASGTPESPTVAAIDDDASDKPEDEPDADAEGAGESGEE